MKTFEYLATDTLGRPQNGRARAVDELELDRDLETQGLTLTQAKVVARERQRHNVRIKREELINLTTQLATVNSAGVPLVQGLQGIGQRSDSDRARQLVEEMVAGLQSGSTLSEVMGQHPRCFPQVYRASVEAGESSGAIDTVLRRMAKYLQWARGIRATTVQALVYPCILAVALFGLILTLLYFVLPRIIKLFPGGRADLPAPTRAVLGFSDFLTQNAGSLAVGGALGVVGLWATFSRPAGQRFMHRLLLKVPKIGRVCSQIATSKFASTASTLHSAGCDVFTVMTVAGQTCGNSALEAAFLKAAEDVRRGLTITESLEREPLIDSLLVQLVSVGEQSGDLGRCLASLAEYYDEEVPRAVKRMISMLEPAMLMGAGAVVAFILLATLMPIFSLYGNIQ